MANYEHPGTFIPADIDSYDDFFQTAHTLYLTATSSASTVTPSQELFVSHHHLMEDIEDKLAKLPSKAFATETNNDFTATFLHSAVLLSWYKMKGMFPDARDVEEQVKGGWNAKKIAVEEWDTNVDYNAIIQIVKDIAKRDEVQVYTVRGFEGRFEVFVLAKMNDGLIGVKAMGVAR